MSKPSIFGGKALPQEPQQAYERGVADGIRMAIQSVGGVMNEEAEAFGELQNPVFQAIRARVKNQLKRRLLKCGS